jgi:malate/lactate dehydrogenase
VVAVGKQVQHPLPATWGVDSQHIHAYVVGEHGDSEVLTWSLATVGGMPLAELCRQHGILFDESVRTEIDHRAACQRRDRV